MNLKEAVEKSLQEGKMIYRESEKDLGIEIMPTNTDDCCLVHRNQKLWKRWNPTADDLIADDWEIKI